MIDDRKTFQEQLLNADQPDPAADKKHREKVRALIETKLSGNRRWLTLIAGLLSIAAGLVCGALSLWPPRPLPPGFAAFGGASALGLIIASVFFFAAFAGSAYHRHRHGWGLGLISCAMLGGLALTLFHLSGWVPDHIVGTQLLFISGTLFCMLAAVLILFVLEHQHQKTEEKLLELEYQMALMNQRLGNDAKA